MSLSTEQIVDAIATKSLMEVMDLVKAIEEKFGVSAAAMAAPAAGGGGGAAAPAAEEKTEFTVMLTGAGANKVQVIKAVRTPARHWMPMASRPWHRSRRAKC